MNRTITLKHGRHECITLKYPTTEMRAVLAEIAMKALIKAFPQLTVVISTE